MDGGNSTVFNLPTQREVSESCYEYLLAELLAHAAPTAAPSSSSSPSSSGEAVPSDEQTEGGVQFQLESLGYDVGYRYCEKLVANQRFASTETLDTVKFLCKEFWEEVFKKKIDKLQTNHRGVFVLSDFRFKWLEKYVHDDPASKQAAAALLLFPCGIVRGALANLGLAAIVTADSSALPACTFSVRIKSL